MAKRTKRILTPQKEQWAQNRDVVLKGTPLRIPLQNEVQYTKELESLVEWMVKRTEKQIATIYKSQAAKEFYAQDETIASRAKRILNKLRKDFNLRFNDKAPRLSKRMVGRAEKASKANLGSSLKELSGGLTLDTGVLNTPEIKTALQATVNQNVSLIKSIPEQFHKKIEGAVMRSITNPQGKGVKGIQDQIMKLIGDEGMKTKRRARNIALDQTRKTYNNLNKVRMENIGITHYRWVHSGGGNPPRKLHKEVLNGQIFAFDDPPIIEEGTSQRGIPGMAINCRCVMVPLITKFSKDS